jgi:hypothetical protein
MRQAAAEHHYSPALFYWIFLHQPQAGVKESVNAQK